MVLCVPKLVIVMAIQLVIVGVLLAAFAQLKNSYLMENVLRYPSVQVCISITRSCNLELKILVAVLTWDT